MSSIAYSDSSRLTVAVVIPTFRRPERLQALLTSLSDGTRLPDEVIVVDNDPQSSPCPELIPGLPLRLLHAGYGLNVAGARNVGWRSASSSVCVFVDDDNIVESSAIDELALVFADPHIGLAAPIIYCGDDDVIWCAGIHRSPWTTRTVWPLHGENTLPDERLWSTEDMPDAFAVPRPVLESLGGFDEERFPFHYEEADLGARIGELGLRRVVVRDAHFRHYNKVHVGIGESMVRATRINGSERARSMARNRIRFHALHYGGLKLLSALGVFIPLWTLATSVACLRARGPWKIRRQTALATIVGTFDGYREIIAKRSPTSAARLKW